MCRWPGYGFQAFEFRTGYINQENNVGNRIYNYIKLINSLIQVAINFLERHNYGHVLNTQNSILSFNTGIQFRTGYQNQAKSSLEQVQVSVGPATHPHQIFCSVSPPPPPPPGPQPGQRMNLGPPGQLAVRSCGLCKPCTHNIGC